METHERSIRGEVLQAPWQTEGRSGVRWLGALTGRLPAPGALVVQ
jgi:hypothetical protein